MQRDAAVSVCLYVCLSVTLVYCVSIQQSSSSNNQHWIVAHRDSSLRTSTWILIRGSLVGGHFVYFNFMRNLTIFPNYTERRTVSLRLLSFSFETLLLKFNFDCRGRFQGGPPTTWLHHCTTYSATTHFFLNETLDRPCLR